MVRTRIKNSSSDYTVGTEGTQEKAGTAKQKNGWTLSEEI